MAFSLIEIGKSQINKKKHLLYLRKQTRLRRKKKINSLNVTSKTEVKIEHSPFRIHFRSYDITSVSTQREYSHIPIPSISRQKISNIHSLSTHPSQDTVSRKAIGSELSPSVNANASMTVGFDVHLYSFSPLKASLIQCAQVQDLHKVTLFSAPVQTILLYFTM